MNILSTREFGLRTRLVLPTGGEPPFVAIDTSVQIGGMPEEEVMLSSMYLSKEEAVGLHLALDKILRDWPDKPKEKDPTWVHPYAMGGDQYSEPYSKVPHAHGKPVEPASKEAP